MKKLFALLMAVAMLAMTFSFTASAAETKIGINDASKWSPSFQDDRAWKTPNQTVTGNDDGSVTFWGTGGDRENFTYGLTEQLNFPAEDLVIEFAINDGLEPEFLFAFALTQDPNWGSWYSNNDTTGMIFTVRPNSHVGFNMAPALEWPAEVDIGFPQENKDDPHITHAVKNKKMTYIFSHTDDGKMTLTVNGFEVEGFEEKYEDFFLDALLPDGKCYLTISGLDYVYDPEDESKLTLFTVKTMPKGTALGSTNEESSSTPEAPTTSETPVTSEPADETPSTDGPVVDDGNEDIGGGESTPQNESSVESADNSANNDNGGDNTVLIVIIVILAVLVVAAAVVVVLLLMKKKAE